MPAKSKAQQAAFGIARAIQKGDRPAGSGPSAKIAKTAKPKDVKDFASTPTKGLPQRVKQEDIQRIREYVTKVVREIVMKRRVANEHGQGLMKSEAGGKGRAKFEFEWYEQGRWLTKTITGTEHDANVMLDKIRDRVNAAGEATGNVSYTKVG